MVFLTTLNFCTALGMGNSSCISRPQRRQQTQVLASLSKAALLSKNHHYNKSDFITTTSLDIKRNLLAETTSAGLFFFSGLMTGNKSEWLDKECV